MVTRTLIVGGAALLPLATPVDIAAQVLDTLHCNARVVVRDAKTGRPIEGAFVSVAPVPSRGAPAGSEQEAFSDADGIAEFAALPAFRYEVSVDGVLAKRKVLDWRPPPGWNVAYREFDLWKHPDEVQRFDLRRRWTVRSGDCTDSLVVLIGSVPWTRPTGKWRLPPGTRLRTEGRPKAGGVVVRAVDDSSNRAIPWTSACIRRPGRYVSPTHWEPEWCEETDSTGQVRLTGIPPGEYELALCNNRYERKRLQIQVDSRAIDTVGAFLRYLGPPADGRRCEVRVRIDPALVLGEIVPTGTVVIHVSEKETGRPVAFGNVVIIGELRGAMTDENGAAAVILGPGMRTLRVDARGRLAQTQKIHVKAGRKETLRVLLEPDPVQVETR